MEWQIEYLPEALDDLKKLDGSVRLRAVKAIRKVKTNPLPQSKGGYGKPLGNRSGTDLSGLMKVKLRSDGIRIVYKLVEKNGVMRVVVIGMRSDADVYREALKRKLDYGM